MDVKRKKEKGFKTKHLGIVGLSAVVIFAIWKFGFTESLSSYKIAKDKVDIEQVVNGKFDDYISVTGSVAPMSTIFLDAYEGGRVKEKLVEEGSSVKAGQIILKLENRLLYEQILASENNLALKQNDLRTTKINFENRQVESRKDLLNAEYEMETLKRGYIQNKALYEEEMISREEYTVSKENAELSAKRYEIIKLQTEQDAHLRETTIVDLDSDLKRMRRTLSMVYERVDQLNVRAPVDGQLGFLDAELGQNINQGDRIGQINVLKEYKIEADIDEHYIDRVRRDLVARFDRNDQEFEVKVKKVYPEVRDGQFKIDLTFVNEPPKNIRTGQNYNMKLQLGESKTANLIPKGWFYKSTGGQWIFVLDESGDFATKRMISIGKRNSRYYEVLDGLSPTEEVIVSNYEIFGDAEKIVLTGNN